MNIPSRTKLKTERKKLKAWSRIKRVTQKQRRVETKEEAVKRTAEKCAEMAPTYEAEAAIRVEFGLLGAK